jgi:hypothetical protein
MQVPKAHLHRAIALGQPVPHLVLLRYLRIPPPGVSKTGIVEWLICTHANRMAAGRPPRQHGRRNDEHDFQLPQQQGSLGYNDREQVECSTKRALCRRTIAADSRIDQVEKSYEKLPDLAVSIRSHQR